MDCATTFVRLTFCRILKAFRSVTVASPLTDFGDVILLDFLSSLDRRSIADTCSSETFGTAAQRCFVSVLELVYHDVPE